MIGTGVMSDWVKWAKGQETPETPQDAHKSGWRRYLSVSYDHKVIGVQYGVTSLVVFGIAGMFALIFRTELAAPGLAGPHPAATYNTIMSLHGIVMIYRDPAGRRRDVELPGAADDRRQRYGLPAPECLCLLDQCPGSDHACSAACSWVVSTPAGPVTRP